MAITSFTMTSYSAQSLPSAATETVASTSNQSTDSTVFAAKAKTALPF